MASPPGKLRLPFGSLAAPSGSTDARRSHVVRVLGWAAGHALGSLRFKFTLAIATLIIALMAAVTFVVDDHQRDALFRQARLRAVSLAKGLASVSEGYLFSYNFIQLEQVVEGIVDDEEDVVYAVVHRRDGRVAVYSRRSDLHGKILEDPVTQRALAATELLVQEVVLPDSRERGYDVAIPIYAPGGSQKWGTIRLGYSLQRAYQEMDQTRRALFVVSLVAIVGGISLAVYMAMRIARPIGQLVAGVHEFAKGAYDTPIRVNTRDEIGYLAAAFEQLRTALHRHIASLEAEKQRLEEAYRRLRETQEQLIQSERLAAVGKLAARVAHEVNNPLAIIKTGIRIVTQSQADEPIKRNLQEIEEEIGRMARIIRGLLDLSRPSPNEGSVQVNPVMQGLELLLRPNLREKDIVVEVALDAGLPDVRLSADQLKQVVLNLVRNAEDAMPNGGTLSLRTARQDGGVQITVTDTGAGIPPECLGHVFDPFFTTKGSEQGMGLGLWVSYGIIQAANGTIAVESEVGKGTTFRIFLPARADVAADAPPREVTTHA